METRFADLKAMLKGTWKGEGFAKFPTITSTAYTEIWRFTPDEIKDTIHYDQHTWYKNDTSENGRTVFWDTGFILLKEEKILLVSAQSGGRLETYELVNTTDNSLTFNSAAIGNDAKTIRSQRVLHLSENRLTYELNMSTHQAGEFQNHLKANLTKTDEKL